ncbi:amidohydrolase [Zhihengliuella halotolerans]|uniref:amidohydrolase n=1 Tax=Zhihengliuella halotolerans TaxID=370736 RepID=UPI000C80EC35|nr:amidohydrolase [Zhihengliuella halotolerans]
MLDLLLTNARVRTFDPVQPWADAVGITGDRIAYVGASTDAPDAREVRHLDGNLVTPGIIDSHNHLLLGFDPDAVSLEGAESLGEVRARIERLAVERPDLEWICAENAVYSIVDDRRPNARDLDGITQRPIFVTTYDQHSVWLNTPALRALGIAAGHDIAWGNPELDRDGQPTGWVTDFYTSAMTRAGLAALQRDIPMYSPERRYRKILGSLEMATRSGITTVVEPQVPLVEIDLFEKALNEGRLSSRVIAALFHPIDSAPEFRQELREAVDDAPRSEMLRFGPIKLYADDVIEPHTAWMLDDYANRPGHRGHPSAPVGELSKIVTELDRLGFQTHTHATGDGGIRLALDAIEASQRINGTRNRRHGIVHVECLDPADLPRFEQLGVTAAMQPRHASPDLIEGTWMDNVGQNRWDRAWRTRSLMESGAHVALSSDWQVGEMDPLVGVYSALTRSGLDGRQSWTPDEIITLDQALCGYTTQGAWAWHSEDELGVLKVGAKADIVAWTADLYQLDPAGILEQRAALTIVAGDIVHDIDGLGVTASSETRFDHAAKTLDPSKSCSGHVHS